MNNTLTLLKDLTNAFGPSGFEDDVINIIKEKANFISTDICGSVYPKTFRGYCTTNEFILQAF